MSAPNLSQRNDRPRNNSDSPDNDSTDYKRLIAAGVTRGWIKGDFGRPMTGEEKRDAYLQICWRLREIELERLKLDNERMKEEMLLLGLVGQASCLSQYSVVQKVRDRRDACPT